MLQGLIVMEGYWDLEFIGFETRDLDQGVTPSDLELTLASKYSSRLAKNKSSCFSSLNLKPGSRGTKKSPLITLRIVVNNVNSLGIKC